MNNPYLKHFLKGILAGLCIGLGGFLYILMVYWFGKASQPELGKVFGSIIFAVGLFLVCTFSLSLYTGKVGELFEESKEGEFVLCLILMLLGNALGAFGLGFACYGIFHNAEIYGTALSVCASRYTLTSFGGVLSCIVTSFLCGTCVYLAVKSYAADGLHRVGTLLLVFFVFLFVYSGFQHCIANMFYFAFGNQFEWQTFLNLFLVILFNSLGPVPAVLMKKLFQKGQYGRRR